MQKLTMKLGDETYLKSVTLTELGMCVGGELHSYMHSAYNDRSGVCESDNTKDFCDDLGPVDSSHVNRHFWKLHGLMDQFIGRWLKANGYDEIATSCIGKVKCYEWRGTWIGDMPGRSQKKD